MRQPRGKVFSLIRIHLYSCQAAVFPSFRSAGGPGTAPRSRTRANQRNDKESNGSIGQESRCVHSSRGDPFQQHSTSCLTQIQLIPPHHYLLLLLLLLLVVPLFICTPLVLEEGRKFPFFLLPSLSLLCVCSGNKHRGRRRPPFEHAGARVITGTAQQVESAVVATCFHVRSFSLPKSAFRIFWWGSEGRNEKERKRNKRRRVIYAR